MKNTLMVKNMIKKTSARLRILSFLCCLAYFASYMTRINYVAVRIAIADELALTHPELVAELAIAISAASVTYGLGQFFSGILGDRFSPVSLVAAGLGGASILNFLMTVMYPKVYWMALVWGINGFFQSLIRPPLGRIIAANFDEKGYIDTCVSVSNSSQIATVSIYLVIPVILRAFRGNWRPAFYLPAMVGLITLALWLYLVPRISIENDLKSGAIQDQKKEKPAPLFSVIIRSGLYMFLLPVLIHGLLRDGITAWMPDFISEIGRLGTDVSIFSTAILPVFCIFCVIIAKKICLLIPSDGKSSCVFFAVSAISALGIVILLKNVNVASFFVIVVLMALITGCMHAVNHIFITRIPGAFKKAGRVSGIVGILNAVTYSGGALSPYAIYLIAGKKGWDTAVVFWLVLSIISAVLCIFASKKWNAFKASLFKTP